MHPVIVPELGEGIEEVTIAAWLVAVGDKVQPDDDVVELVTDKASFNIPAGFAGIIQEILVREGNAARIGETVALIKPETIEEL